ncbi:MAG TPA: choice-of-anchor tandem repeat GloVer-containing protein [Terriglobales bacterium]|nr:choice-of-anchor tandem repeat GloVer-containing protein [Terriglobales bacterium]
MTNPVQHGGSVSRIRLRAPSAALAFAIMLAPAVVAVQSAQAQAVGQVPRPRPLPTRNMTLTVLHKFEDKTDGGYPLAGLFLDKAGNLFGTTSLGGRNSCSDGCGIVFKLDKTNKETVLHRFTGRDGNSPDASLIADAAGNSYGITQDGGSGGCGVGCGTVFRVDKFGTTTVLYTFTGGADGGTPSGGLIEDADGSVYGATFWGGDLSGCSTNGCGVLFKLDRFGSETVLYSFAGKVDGANPNGGLVRDARGNFYGTAAYGGDSSCYLGCGAVFELDKNGHFTVLHSFTAGADGVYPYAGLIRDTKGNLYGTTAGGGKPAKLCPTGCGTVFKVGKTGEETVLYSFKGGTDGVTPYAGLIRDAAGNLYGTTPWGGDPTCSDGIGGRCGVVFKVDSTGKETVLYRFKGADGDGPYRGSLVRDAAGNLYGTTSYGGNLSCGGTGIGCGVVFKLTP